MTRCPDCSGTGHYLTASRIAGELIDADYIERDCESCDGLGEVDHLCPPNRMCPDCGSMPLHILHDGLAPVHRDTDPESGRERVAA